RCGDMDGFAVTRLVIGAGFLPAAAVADVRTRRVPDSLWIGLGSIGLVVLAVEFIQDQIEADAWALLGSAGLLFFAIFYGNPLFEQDGFHARPFRLFLFLVAAVLFLAVPLGLLLLNAARGNLAFPQALLGYRARLDTFPPHVWLMEKISARGDHVLVLFPKRGGSPTDDLERLRAAGIDRAWVTPQMPFMVPLAGGFLLAFFVGNVLLGLLRLVG